MRTAGGAAAAARHELSQTCHIFFLEPELYFACSRLSALGFRTGQQELTDAARTSRLEPERPCLTVFHRGSDEHYMGTVGERRSVAGALGRHQGSSRRGLPQPS